MKSYISLLSSVLFVAFAVLSCNQPEPEVLVTDVSINQASAEIIIGETLQLNATVTQSNASQIEVIWASSAPSVAKVSNQGLVTALSEGTTVITATAGGKSGVCTITVKSNLPPSVTVGVEQISAVSAMLRGKANLGSTVSSNLVIGFQYSKSSGILPSNSITVEAKDADSDYNYSIGINGLEPDVTYYFRSFVREKGQDTYGETMEFKTKDISSLLKTKEATAVSAVSAKLSADVDLTNVQCAGKSVGFYYGSNSASLSEKVISEGASGNVNAIINALTPASKYYYQAFIIIDEKEYKESILSFSTKELQTLLETTNASSITATGANLTAKLNLSDVQYSNLSYGFYWGNSASTQNTSVKGGQLNNNVFSASLSNLSHQTQYWYKAYVVLDNQTFYGDVKSFTTGSVSVESVSLDRSSYSFKTIGDQITLKATVLPSNATDKSVTWTSDNASVAKVDASGTVTAVGNGTATITVTTNNSSKKASCTITVAQVVTGITLDKTSLDLAEGKTYSLTATITPSNANNRSITWTSSKTSVATVDQSGKVTAISLGTATIKAAANDGSGKYATCTITVKRFVTSITLSKTSMSLFIGEKESIEATVYPSNADNTEVQWSTSGYPAGFSNFTGHSNVIHANGKGTATITATAMDGSGVYATCVVEVKQAITSINLGKKSLEIAEGKTYKFSPTVSPYDANDKSLSWTSSNNSIATVDNSGNLTAVSPGIVDITATAKDGSGISTTCKVSVFKMPQMVDMGLSVKWASLNLGATSIEDFGDYYAWAETETHYEVGYSQSSSPKWKSGITGYNWASYKWCNGSMTTLTKYNTESRIGKVDNITQLELSDDAARQKLGGNWRIPTDTEWAELINSSSWEILTQNGVKGVKFTSNNNGNTLFIPMAGLWNAKGYFTGIGLYWTANIPKVQICHSANTLYIDLESNYKVYQHERERSTGVSIRPVSE